MKMILYRAICTDFEGNTYEYTDRDYDRLMDTIDGHGLDVFDVIEEEDTMKIELQKKFNELYEGKRLLAVQLNGFTHKLFYDNGTSDSNVVVEEFSPWTSLDRQTDQSEALLKNFSTYTYKNNPVEIVYLNPEER